MTILKTPMDVLRLVERSNCRLCGQPTCLAFAAAVIKGQKQLAECPKVDPETAGLTAAPAPRSSEPDNDIEKALKTLRARARQIDIPTRAARLGLPIVRNRLAIPVLGKKVYLDEKGELSADIHLHAWLSLPIYKFVLDSTGVPVTNKWVSLRELKKGPSWLGLFQRRCEEPLKALIEKDPDLFADMISIFNGRPSGGDSDADYAVILDPLPRTPLMLAYWKPEDGIESNLKILFDSTVEENLDIESIYAVAAGLTHMFEKILPKHFGVL
ncbi:MAG: DUF3786 domain-containing protein [Pseudomonadota bacterium]